MEAWSAAAAAKLLQSCLTLCDPIDGSPPGSTIPGILQARTLEWVAVFFSRASKWKVKVKLLSRVRLFETPWTAAYEAPLSMGFSRQEYWSGLPLPSPEEWSGPEQMIHASWNHKKLVYKGEWICGMTWGVRSWTWRRQDRCMPFLLDFFCCILRYQYIMYSEYSLDMGSK